MSSKDKSDNSKSSDSKSSSSSNDILGYIVNEAVAIGTLGTVDNNKTSSSDSKGSGGKK